MCGKVQERDGKRKKVSHEGGGKSKCVVAGKATRSQGRVQCCEKESEGATKRPGMRKKVRA